MKNEMIATVLKRARHRNTLSVKDVAALLDQRSNHVAEKTIYGWESGQSQPDADTLFMLCEIYGIDDILSAFGYQSDPGFHVSKPEKEMILAMREQPDMIPAIKRILGLN